MLLYLNNLLLLNLSILVVRHILHIDFLLLSFPCLPMVALWHQFWDQSIKCLHYVWSIVLNLLQSLSGVLWSHFFLSWTASPTPVWLLSTFISFTTSSVSFQLSITMDILPHRWQTQGPRWALHLVSTQRSAELSLMFSYIYTVLKLHSALWRQPRGWCVPRPVKMSLTPLPYWVFVLDLKLLGNFSPLTPIWISLENCQPGTFSTALNWVVLSNPSFWSMLSINFLKRPRDCSFHLIFIPLALAVLTRMCQLI